MELKEVVEKLEERGALAVVLFGSAVDSPYPQDFDLLIIVKGAPESLEERVEFETELVKDLLGPFDFLIVTKEEFRAMRDSGLYAEIYSRHKVLYDSGFFERNIVKPSMIKVGDGLWMRARQ